MTPTYYCHTDHCYILEHQYLTHKRLKHDVEIQDRDQVEETEKDALERGEMEL